MNKEEILIKNYGLTQTQSKMLIYLFKQKSEGALAEEIATELNFTGDNIRKQKIKLIALGLVIQKKSKRDGKGFRWRFFSKFEEEVLAELKVKNTDDKSYLDNWGKLE